MTAILETCCCGATFKYEGGYADIHASSWRKYHRHEWPVPMAQVDERVATPAPDPTRAPEEAE